MFSLSANLSLLFTEFPLVERVAQAKQAGFDAVEIQFPYEADMHALKNALHENAMPLDLINIPAGDLLDGGDGFACVPNQQHAFREAVQTALKWARELGVAKVNLLAGRQPLNKEKTECLKTLIDNARYAAEVFEEAGVKVLIEAINAKDMPRFLISTMDQQLDIIQIINHNNIGLQFDIYHMAMNGEDVLQLLRQHINHIDHIQFADYPQRHEPGAGQLNFSEIFNLLVRLNYPGRVAAEYHPSSRIDAGMDASHPQSDKLSNSDTHASLAWLNSLRETL